MLEVKVNKIEKSGFSDKIYVVTLLTGNGIQHINLTKEEFEHFYGQIRIIYENNKDLFE